MTSPSSAHAKFRLLAAVYENFMKIYYQTSSKKGPRKKKTKFEKLILQKVFLKQVGVNLL